MAVSQTGMLRANNSPTNPVAANKTALHLKACSKLMCQGLDVLRIDNPVNGRRRKPIGIRPWHDGDGVAALSIRPKVMQGVGGALQAGDRRSTLAEGEHSKHRDQMVCTGP
jgi:hypothetical protein